MKTAKRILSVVLSLMVLFTGLVPVYATTEAAEETTAPLTADSTADDEAEAPAEEGEADKNTAALEKQ